MWHNAQGDSGPSPERRCSHRRRKKAFQRDSQKGACDQLQQCQSQSQRSYLCHASLEHTFKDKGKRLIYQTKGLAMYPLSARHAVTQHSHMVDIRLFVHGA